MKELKLSMGQKSFDEISNYISENYKESYSLSIYDILGKKQLRLNALKKKCFRQLCLLLIWSMTFQSGLV